MSGELRGLAWQECAELVSPWGNHFPWDAVSQAQEGLVLVTAKPALFHLNAPVFKWGESHREGVERQRNAGAEMFQLFISLGFVVNFLLSSWPYILLYACAFRHCALRFWTETLPELAGACTLLLLVYCPSSSQFQEEDPCSASPGSFQAPGWENISLSANSCSAGLAAVCLVCALLCWIIVSVCGDKNNPLCRLIHPDFTRVSVHFPGCCNCFTSCLVPNDVDFGFVLTLNCRKICVYLCLLAFFLSPFSLCSSDR